MAVYNLTEGADTFPTNENVSGADEIYGRGGDDVLEGGAGADLLDGGDGDDTVTYARSTVGVFINPMGTVPRNDGTGDRFVSIEHFLLSAYDDYLRADTGFTAGITVDGGNGKDRVYATKFDDALRGGEGADDLRGNDGSDRVEGGIGDDLLDGGAGQDQLFGGDGDDLLQSGTNSDFVDGGTGFDTMILYGSPEEYELSLRDDGAVQIRRLTSEYEDGGYTTVNNSTDVVVNVERLRYYDGTIFDLGAWIDSNMAPGRAVQRGTDAAETLTGTGEDDALFGLGGNDQLDGAGGDDLLFGGGGADAFDGGTGFDVVDYRNAGSAVRVGVPVYDGSEPGNQGAGDSFAGVERIELTALDDTLYWRSAEAIEVSGNGGDDLVVLLDGQGDIEGGAGADRIVGGAQADTLSGGEGTDRLEGGAGDDVLDGGLGADELLGGEGHDTVTFEGRSAGVIVGYTGSEDSDYSSIEAFELTDFADRIRLPASRGDNGISPASLSDVFAGGGDDLIEAGAIAGRLYGEGGNDTIVGPTYGTFIDGGTGDDAITSQYRDDVIEGGEGYDTVFYTRPLSEYMIERDGDVIVVAHAESGAVDRLTGVELLSFPHPVFTEQETVETATVGAPVAARSMRMGSAGADAFVAEDPAAAQAYFGLDGDDQASGGAGADMLSGGGGSDRLEGLGGVDSLYGGDGNDVLLGGLLADTLTGGLGNDEVDGGDGDDMLLLAEGGDEFAQGGGGDDGFYFGAALTAADRVDGGAGTGDQLALQGDYALVLGASNLAGVETLGLLSGSDTRFGAGGDERFTYRLTTQDTNVATGERLTINANGLLAGEDLTFDGKAERDGSFTIFGGLGADVLSGGAQSDGFFFGSGRLGADDRIDGFSGADDQLALRGDYTTLVDFAADTIRNIDTVALISASDTRYGGGSDNYGYNLKSHDGNLAAGQLLTVTGSALTTSEALRFDGSAELDGFFRLIGGADQLFGGLGADQLAGNGGNDRFVYSAVDQSTAASRDTISGFASGDRIDLSGIDAILGTAANETFAFIGSGAFSAAGQVRLVQSGSDWLLEANVDGTLTADLVIGLGNTGAYVPGAADIML
jgi:Ca2+-binding RTX toxin-like protein